MKVDRFPQWPRGLSRSMAAQYVGVSFVMFDKMVAEGDMPQPKRFYQRTIWDKIAVDKAFDLLDSGHERDASGEEIIEFRA